VNLTVIENVFLDVPDDFPFFRYGELLTDIRIVLDNPPDVQIGIRKGAAFVSFGCDYIDLRNAAVCSFAIFLMECANEFRHRSNHLMSPYISVVQS